AMLSVSSTMIVSKVYDELGCKGKKFAELALGALVIEDIVAVFLMVVLSTVVVGRAEGGEMVLGLARMVLYLVIWFVLAVLIVPSVLKRVARALNDEILITVSVALCLAMVMVANAIGFSAALGAFLAGSILAGTALAHRVEGLFKPVRDLFGAVFFVSVGMMVSPSQIGENAVPIAIIVLVVLVGMPLFSGIGALAGQSLKTAVKCGLSLSQVGEFSFIIASLGCRWG
ncbi:MAG: cation:proton antiporter, partial [Eggerthellaceae bacterium]